MSTVIKQPLAKQSLSKPPQLRHPLTIDGGDPKNVRGDKITAERYFSREYMQREWDQLWTKIWHIAGRVSQLAEAGDYIVHNFTHESVLIVKQADGSLKGFYNVCQHRGQRLVWHDGSQDAFTCPYHGWQWGLDGKLEAVTDPEDFPQGNPCGKLTLRSVRVDAWAGMVWYTLDERAPALRAFLAPLPEIYQNFPLETMIRTRWVRVDNLPSNWKMYSDNFNESYHTQTAHPHIVNRIDQDYRTSQFDMFPNGHARILQLGRPSFRDRPLEGEETLFDELLREWGLDPESYPDYETKAVQGWLDLKAAKRAKAKERGMTQYEKLTDSELTESMFNFIFPNHTFSIGAEGCRLTTWEPHPNDPEKCSFEYWDLTYPNEIQKAFRPKFSNVLFEVKEAQELERYTYDEVHGIDSIAKNTVIYQDWGLSPGQQAGWRSRGYEENPYLAAQETRVRRFHEVLNDYIAGSPPGR